MPIRSQLALTVVAMAALSAATSVAAQLPTPKPPDTVFLEELTWDELAFHIKNGKTTAIIGTAGTEQKGPHMAIGEHKYVTTYCADKIARALGNAIVAPIITYVPEAGHMGMAGTIDLPENRFEMLLELTARSLRGSGFKEIILIGDSGGNRDGMRNVAAKLNADSVFKSAGVRMHWIDDYYTKAHSEQDAYVTDTLKLVTRQTLGGHANILDTSELMFIHPELVNKSRLSTGGQGVSGDNTKANPALGKYLLDVKIKLALAQIKTSLAAPRQEIDR